MLIVVTAPSGTGKTSIWKEVLKMCPDLHYSVSYTTRPPRPGEEDGKDYYFISEEDFRTRIKQGDFLEWVENYGYLYGTSAEIIRAFQDNGFDLILDLEPCGAKKLKERCPDGIFVFILPPSFAELERRLIMRGSEEDEAMRERLAKARDEIREVIWYDYVIFNEKLPEAIDYLRSIYIAEKTRRSRQVDSIKDFIDA